MLPAVRCVVMLCCVVSASIRPACSLLLSSLPLCPALSPPLVSSPVFDEWTLRSCRVVSCPCMLALALAVPSHLHSREKRELALLDAPVPGPLHRSNRGHGALLGVHRHQRDGVLGGEQRRGVCVCGLGRIATERVGKYIDYVLQRAT